MYIMHPLDKYPGGAYRNHYYPTASESSSNNKRTQRKHIIYSNAREV